MPPKGPSNASWKCNRDDMESASARGVQDRLGLRLTLALTSDSPWGPESRVCAIWIAPRSASAAVHLASALRRPALPKPITLPRRRSRHPRQNHDTTKERRKQVGAGDRRARPEFGAAPDVALLSHRPEKGQLCGWIATFTFEPCGVERNVGFAKRG